MNEDAKIKIADFGLSRLFSDEQQKQKQQQNNQNSKNISIGELMAEVYFLFSFYYVFLYLGAIYYYRFVVDFCFVTTITKCMTYDDVSCIIAYLYCHFFLFNTI
jgi:serine/threonine protein kinase